MIDTLYSVSKEVAKELEIDEKIVKKVNAFYWKNIADTIASGQHNAIRIKNFGSFVVSKFKLYTQIKKKIKKIKYYRTIDKDFKRKTRLEYINEQIRDLKLFLERRNEMAILYKAQQEAREERIRIKKLKYVDNF